MKETEKKIREKNVNNGYRMLITAIVRQAVKDKAVWFFETDTGKGYCAIVGINPVNLIGGRV